MNETLITTGKLSSRDAENVTGSSKHVVETGRSSNRPGTETKIIFFCTSKRQLKLVSRKRLRVELSKRLELC